MTDIDRGGGDRGAGSGDEDRLPWLEAVEDEQDRGGPGVGRLVAAVVVALAVIGLVVGGVFWLRDRNAQQLAAGQGELIPAPPGAYKTKPADAGGMKVEGQGDTAYAASEGAETNAAINLNALPEAPVTDTAGKVPAGPAASPAKPAATPPATPGTAPAAAPLVGGTIQLGAFSSEAKATAAWKSLSGRFAFLAPLTSGVTQVKSGAATLYRLRATAGPQAASVCAKLKVAGETCAVVG